MPLPDCIIDGEGHVAKNVDDLQEARETLG